MTRKEIIDGLKFTVDMFLLNPNTGETREDYEINDMDRTTIDACKGAIELLKQEPKTDYKAFTEWVASEIFSEDWEFNKDSFAEIACRKLSKLGIVAIGPLGTSVWKLKEGEE